MTSSLAKVNVQNAEVVCDVLDRAAHANLNSPQRNGSVIDLPHHGQLLITGDLHDARINFAKVLSLAALGQSPDRHVILQEMVHGENLVNGVDLSYRMLVEAAALSLQYPQQVHTLLANHELAQINGDDISKHGVSSVDAFNDGIDFVFGDDGDAVRKAIIRYVKSFALAVRCANGIMCCHSLPHQRHREKFDPMVLTRTPNDHDLYGPKGSAYLMVWGRNIAQNWASDLASLWGCDEFVMGHQPAEMGYECAGDTMLILNSDHSHGVALPIDLAQRYNRVELIDQIIPLAAVAGTQ